MSDDVLWIVASLGEELYGLPADDVEAMLVLPPVSNVPHTPAHVRGLFFHRERAIPVINLRRRLGLPSLAEETDSLMELLKAREADHVAWLTELQASVAEKRLFKLTTDPHACAFGKWYDSYRTDNLLVAGLLKKFDAPHRRIHGIADEIVALEREGRSEEAQALIDRTRDGDLARMITLFARLRAQLLESQREIAVVASVGGKPQAIVVDAVETVSRLSDVDGEAMDDVLGAVDDTIVTGARRLEKSGQLVVCLTLGGLVV